MLAPVLTSSHATPLGVDAAVSLDASPSGAGSSGAAASHDEASESTRRNEICSTLLAAAEAFGLQDCWQWKPLMDGKQVCTARMACKL